MGLLGSAGQAGRAQRASSRRAGTARSGRSRASSGTQLMPGVFAQAGMEYASRHDGVGFEQFAKVAEKNHAHSTLNPLAQYQQGVLARGGDGRGDDRLSQHAAHVLPDR